MLLKYRLMWSTAFARGPLVCNFPIRTLVATAPLKGDAEDGESSVP